MFDFLYVLIINLLIDSLWIGGFSWLFMIILLRLINSKYAILRYNVSLLIFFGSFILLLILAIAQQSIYDLWLKPKILVFSNYAANFSLEFNFIEKIQLFVLNNSIYIFWLWVIGLFVFIIRLLFQFRAFSRIQEISLVKGDSLYLIKENLMKVLSIRKKVILRETNNLSHIFTIGYLKPIIYLPPQILTGFTTEELEMVLFHELIHIKRNDYLINIIQLTLKGIFFFNPFILFMSSMIKKERETSCDAIVISYGYSKTLYAKALQNSYELHYKLALNFGNHNVFSRIKFLTLFRPEGKKPKIISNGLLGVLALCIMTMILGFGVSAKKSISNNLITKDIKVYPYFTIKDGGNPVIFHPDPHRAWHIYEDGKQAFYRDGELRNEELEANFEYKEIDKGDVLEIIYVDKLLNREHKAGRKQKQIFDSKPFIKELYEDFNIETKTYDVNELMRKLHITPFGDMYFNNNKISKKLQEKYKRKYPVKAFEYYGYRFLDKEAEALSFLKNMIYELQKDGLVNANFNQAQVVFKLQKGGRLLLNGNSLSKTHTEKYMIYLNRFSSGGLYEGHSFYIK